VESGKQTFDISFRNFSNEVSHQIKKIDRIAGTTLREKAQAKLRNEPTEAVAKMRDALDKYETPPETLSKREQEVFQWFRNLTRTIFQWQNDVRQSLGIDPIPYRQAYVRHVAESISWEICSKVFNPMEMPRLADDLEAYYTRNLEHATKSMLWTALKEIYLSKPLRTYKEQLSAITQDMPIYETLTPAELARVSPVMPASTRKWVTDYVNQVIKGQPTDLDQKINRFFLREGFSGIVNKVLKPFGRSMGLQPASAFGQVTGRTVLASVLGPLRPKLILRNKLQLGQNLALYTLKSNARGQFETPEWMKPLVNKSLYYRGYTGLEDAPPDVYGQIERLWHGAYRWSAISNAHVGMKVAGWDAYDLVTNPKYEKYGWADPKRTYTEDKDFLYPSEQAKILKEMEFGAQVTQYSYIPMGLPELFRHKTLSPFTRLQSWWMNYISMFWREIMQRSIKGETSYGSKLPWSRRLAGLKYLAWGGAVLSALGYERSFAVGVLPTFASPMGQFVLGLYGLLTAKDERQRKRALRQVFYSWRAFVPGMLMFEDFKRVWEGEKPIESIFFYRSFEDMGYGEKEKGVTPTPTPTPTPAPTPTSGGGGSVKWPGLK
jgi:hypothetical protein